MGLDEAERKAGIEKPNSYPASVLSNGPIYTIGMLLDGFGFPDYYYGLLGILDPKRKEAIHEKADELKNLATANSNWQHFKTPRKSHLKVDFLMYVRRFLTWKNHEWLIVAVLGSSGVTDFWIKKGTDDQVSVQDLPVDEIKQVESKVSVEGLLCIHNHPGGLPAASGDDRVVHRQLSHESNVAVESYVYGSANLRKYSNSFWSQVSDSSILIDYILSKLGL